MHGNSMIKKKQIEEKENKKPKKEEKRNTSNITKTRNQLQNLTSQDTETPLENLGDIGSEKDFVKFTKTKYFPFWWYI